jgi:putative membrane protein
VAIFASYFNEACILISAICFAIGWGQIRKKRVRIHRRWMLTGVVFAALFFISYALKTFLIGDTKFGGPKSVSPYYYVFLQAHSILATVAAILGVITLIFAARSAFGKHRRIGPWTVVIWFVTAATGLAVFFLLFIIYPPGATANLWQSYLGK